MMVVLGDDRLSAGDDTDNEDDDHDWSWCWRWPKERDDDVGGSYDGEWSYNPCWSHMLRVLERCRDLIKWAFLKKGPQYPGSCETDMSV